MPHGQLNIFNWAGVNDDAFDLYGVSLSDGAIATLLAPAAAKERVSNESRLESGKRIDIQAPTPFQARELTLEMHRIAATYEQFLTRYRAFMDAITATGQGILLSYTVYGQQIRFKLQYLSCTQFAAYNGQLAKFALRFVERTPGNGVVSLTLNGTNDNEEEENG